jgi:hypothetical protein
VWRVDGSFLGWRGWGAASLDEVRARSVITQIHAIWADEQVVALHGSVVQQADGAWMILGESGAGKSTTVLSLMREGARLVVDDRASVRFDVGRVLSAGELGMRLWPNTGDPPGALRWERMVGRADKRWWFLDECHYTRGEVPLAGVICLENRHGASWAGEITRLEGMEAWLSLMRHCFDVSAPPEPWARRRLVGTKALASRVGVWRVSYARSEDGAPRHLEAVRRVIGDAR